MELQVSGLQGNPIATILTKPKETETPPPFSHSNHASIHGMHRYNPLNCKTISTPFTHVLKQDFPFQENLKKSQL